jgi:hypothetical protein
MLKRFGLVTLLAVWVSTMSPGGGTVAAEQQGSSTPQPAGTQAA